MPTPQQIRAELDADPLELGYAVLVTARSWQALADLLNARTGGGAATVNRPSVSRGELLEALASAGALQPLYAADTSHPAFDLAKTAALILDDPAGELDYTRAGTRALVAALGPNGHALLSAPQLSALVAVCTRTGSRAEVLWGEQVTAQQVRAAGRLS